MQLFQLVTFQTLVAFATTTSVLDIANSDKLLVTQAAISKIEEVLA